MSQKYLEQESARSPLLDHSPSLLCLFLILHPCLLREAGLQNLYVGKRLVCGSSESGNAASPSGASRAIPWAAFRRAHAASQPLLPWGPGLSAVTVTIRPCDGGQGMIPATDPCRPGRALGPAFVLPWLCGSCAAVPRCPQRDTPSLEFRKDELKRAWSRAF